MIATAAVEGIYKVRWLRWWNLLPGIRKDYKFPETVTDVSINRWLNRAAFWAGIEEMATQQLKDYMSLICSIDESKVFETFEDYIDKWRCLI